MDKSQRMIERRLYLHDVHGRVGNTGWHRAPASDNQFFLRALAFGTLAFILLGVMAR